MPNLERRYTPQEGAVTHAWIFGIIDALEFFQAGYDISKKDHDWFPIVASQLTADVAELAEENWKDEFDQLKGSSSLPVPEGRGGADSREEASIASRPTWAGQDSGGAEWARGARPVQSTGQPRHSHSHPACKCEERLDQDDRAIRFTEISTNGCGGSGHWFINKEGHLIGVCSCLASYGPDSSSR
jgi:hypothetical protein